MSDLPPMEPIHGTLAVDAFGKSYHTNRDVRWNETNPGLGVTVAFPRDSADGTPSMTDVTLSVGTYRDSFNAQAKYGLVGLRFMAGEREGLHAAAGASVGILDGSGNTGLGFMPVLSIGYDRFDLCVTGMYDKDSDGPRDRSGHVDPRIATTSVIACFLSVTLLRF